MTLIEFIKKKVFKLNKGYEKVDTNAQSTINQTFSNRTFTRINRFFLDEINVHYNGDSTKILEFYTKANIQQYPTEPIRSRNCFNYFWAKSATETNIKRTTANLVRTITLNLVNYTGVPQIYSPNEIVNNLVNKIIEQNELYEQYNEEITHTIYEGWGAYKVNIDTLNNDYPEIIHYRAQNCWIVKENSTVKAIIFFDNYKSEDGKQYVVADTRYVMYRDGTPYSCVDLDAFIVKTNADYEKISLNELSFLKSQQEHSEFPNIPFILGEGAIFYEAKGLENEGLCGRSVFYGKIDAIDDYDQAISIQSTAIRRSAPKVTYPVSSIDMVNGEPQTPDDFDTQYINVPYEMDGNGGSTHSNTPTVVQPQINLKIYDEMQESALEVIIGGLVSLNDIGRNAATFFRDSAEAIRERSRQTLYTVNYIRKKEQKILKSLMNKCIALYNYFWKGVEDINVDEYEVNVRYDKFLSPSKEQKVKVYLPMFQSGAISTDKFVRLVYEDEMSEEEIEKEVEQIEKKSMLAMFGKQSVSGIDFKNEVPTFEKNSNPHKDGTTEFSDNGGMNNHNRGIKGVKEI